MRIFVFITFLISIYGNLTAQNSDKLNRHIHFPDSLKQTRQFIDFLYHETGYFFSYDSDLINDTATVTFSNTDSLSAKEIIYHLTGTKSISFNITESHVIITKTEPESIKNIINGQVISETEPLPRATVYLKNSMTGVITNDDGEFILKIPEHNATDTLIISHIGYTTKIIPINKPINEQLKIELIPHIFPLNEITITAVSPESIIRKMLQNTKNMYPKQNINYHTFYREEVRIDDNYKYFSEAVLEVFKNSYNHIFNAEKIKVIQSRTLRSLTTDSLLLKIKSGLKTALYLDVIRYQPDFLHAQTLNRYHYNIDEITHQDNELIYVISFRPKRNSEEALYSGKIFINGQYNALKKVHFQYASHQKHKLKELLSNNYERLRVKPQQAHYEVRYQEMGGTWYLQYINSLIELKLKQKKDWFSTPISVKSSFYVVGVDTLNVIKPSNREVVNPSIIFSESNFNYEPEFWGKYNFHKPSNQVISDLKKMLQVKKEVKLIP